MQSSTPQPKDAPGRAVRWDVVVPFYNEEGFLGATLASLAAQTRPARYILVDNASTDGSRRIAEAFAETLAVGAPLRDVAILIETTPGKASALERGIAGTRAEFVATCDADTFYPPTYLERAERMLTDGAEGAVAALAFGVSSRDPDATRLERAKGVVASRLMPSQTHSGGYGQAFRTDALKAVGGFSRDLWPFCLMDHEIMHRLSGRGRLAYAYDHWCAPSARRTDRSKVRWTLSERLLYHVVPASRRDWFFYEFLTGRFRARGVSELNLRAKSWTGAGGEE